MKSELDKIKVYTILVLYGNVSFPQKKSLTNHLYSIRDYTSHRCVFFNAYYAEMPNFIKYAHFDLIIFHTTFMVIRWSDRQKFVRIMKKISVLKNIISTKIAIPQDEYINTDLMNEFINEFNVEHVFTVSPFSELDKIYPQVDRSKVQFHSVLTGYLSPQDLMLIERLRKDIPVKTIDIGYRAEHAPAWWGRQGLLKVKIAEIFKERAKDFLVDISTRPEDTFFGNDWYAFLLKCKFTIGVEGGSSLLDENGDLKRKTIDYLKKCLDCGFKPDFYDIEKNIFPNRDGEISVVALSPRHLEACATKTCQVLIEGRYNGILEPNIHYIELKSDFSNLDLVLEKLKDEKLRISMAERAYQDIVMSQKYAYASFVSDLILKSLGNKKPYKRTFLTEFVCVYISILDFISWILVYFRNILLKYLPYQLVANIRRWRKIG
ncbi:MAG: hypothetical protein AB7I41_02245 [Candidatus Sericytochromatia bacterium]